MKNRFYIGDGCDAVGKSTQLNLLANHLRELGYNVMSTRALGGDGKDYIQNEFRKLLLSPEFPADRTADEERIFSLTDLFNVEQIEDFLAKDPRNVVVQDRGFLSHIAYFAAKKHSDFTIARVHNDLFRAYATVARRFGLVSINLLAEDGEMAMERVKSRGGQITPRLENVQMQNAVLEQLRQGPELIQRFPVLRDAENLKNIFLTVTRKDSIQDVQQIIAGALMTEDVYPVPYQVEQGQ